MEGQKMTAVRIKVLKRDLYPDLVKQYGGHEIQQCEVFREGQEFITGMRRPDDFCDWAWNDIYRPVITLLNNGSFGQSGSGGWMKDDKTMVACCTDGFRPVSFLLERIDTKDLIDTSGDANAAPAGIYASERWGEFTYTLDGLTAGKNYLLRLHFLEMYFYAAGRRNFSVEVNGSRVIENIDLFTVAGGSNKPYIKDVPVTASDSGKITVNFMPGTVDNPKVSAIELFDAGGKAVKKINCGGNKSGDFEADNSFTGGNVVGG